MRTAFAVSCLLSVVAFGQPGQGGHVPGRLLVQIRRGAAQADVAKALNAHGANQQKNIAGIDVAVLQVNENALAKVQDALSRTGLFTFVEPDGIGRAALTPNDPSYPSQWHLSTIQAASAWGITTGTSTPIAIIDSGVEPTHPDLASKLVSGWNFLTGTSDTRDDDGHGTAVAGAAAAATNNGIGVAGVAWSSPIMPLVTADSSGYASYSNIASAITYAADHGARVINISIAGTAASSTLQSAINYAWNKGSIIFAAAANDSTSTPYYPAACDNTVAVSATTSSDTFASYSDYGNWIDLSAPGTSILTTNTGGSYASWSGTSLATPIAAGVAALVLGARPAMSNSTLVSLLEQNSDDLGAPGYDQYYGWGRVNAYRAVSAALGNSSDTVPPVVAINSPANGSAVSGVVQVQGSATDNVGVTKIEFYVDGQLISSAASSPFAFSWTSTAAANASHSLTVKAYDVAGNIGSAGISVTVNNVVARATPDIQPPIVNITSPLPGATVSGNTKVVVSASDNVAVSQVSIYIDGVQVTQCTTAQCTYNWNTRKAAPGMHTITAKAWDPSGNMGVSAPDTVGR